LRVELVWVPPMLPGATQRPTRFVDEQELSEYEPPPEVQAERALVVDTLLL